MRKTLFLLCAMLCCFQAFAQGAEFAGRTTESEDSGTSWLIVPRVEVNPYLPLKDGGYKGFDLGFTSLWTLFDGSFGDSDFSYSVEAHLLSSDPKALYQNTLRSDDVNWLDWANITYAPSSLYLTVGKQVMSVGSYEIDDYDYDSHINFCSSLWNNLVVYQWGAAAGWISEDESTDLSLQMVTSPYGEKPFSSGLYSYSALWRGEYGAWMPLWSVGAMAYDKGAYVGHIAVANQFSLGDFTLGLDLSTRGYDFSFTEHSAVALLGWEPSEKFSLKAKYGIEINNDGLFGDVIGWDPSSDGDDPADYYVPASLAQACFRQFSSSSSPYQFGGVVAEYRPMDNLRVHAALAANNWAKSLSVNIGATYFLSLRK